MKFDREARMKRAVELKAAGLERALIAERLGCSPGHVTQLLAMAKRVAN